MSGMRERSAQPKPGERAARAWAAVTGPGVIESPKPTSTWSGIRAASRCASRRQANVVVDRRLVGLAVEVLFRKPFEGLVDEGRHLVRALRSKRPFWSRR